MANIKTTSETIFKHISEWKENAQSRGNELYYLQSEKTEEEIHQYAWDNCLIINITPVNKHIAKIKYVDFLNN